MSLLLRGIFWNEYEIHKSPGDGHCLLHSVISSLHFQSSVNLTISELIQGIIDETSTKSDFYKDFMKGSLYDLYRGLNAYVNYKVYDTSFGDLVPHIISNAIHVNITIVSGTQNQGYATHLVPCTASETQHDIVIWKAGKHYDGWKAYILLGPYVVVIKVTLRAGKTLSMWKYYQWIYVVYHNGN